jgi:hypothetical protein
VNQVEFLNLRQRPARVNSEQAGWLIGCQPHDLPVLVVAKLVKPLGNPPQNGSKYFSTAEVLEACQDRNWLVRVTKAIQDNWARRNARYTGPGAESALSANSRN